MTLRLVAVVIAALGLSALPAGADGGALPTQLSVTNGPPGTVVTITGITPCSTPMTVGWADPDRLSLIASGPIAPPSGTITVPSVVNGSYLVVLTCGVQQVSFPFEVVGSTVTAPIVAAPVFTG